MSGHSKWATTKRQKAVVDAKKGSVFTKIGNLITIAARQKGGDPAVNFMLRMAIDKAKAANMPKDNIERSIKRGTGELGDAAIEELTYEGFGPAKAQFIVKSVTDNKNRSASTIRHLFTKYGGSFGSAGWNFQEQGVVRIEKSEVRSQKLEDENFELELIEKGAQDIEKAEEGMTIYTQPGDLQKVKQFLEENNIVTETAGIEFVAKEKAAVSDADRETLEKFIEELEDNEDVSDYFTNAVI